MVECAAEMIQSSALCEVSVPALPGLPLRQRAQHHQAAPSFVLGTGEEAHS